MSLAGVGSKVVRNVRTSSQFVPQRKDPEGSGWGLVDLEESLAVTNKSRRLLERLKAITGKCGKAFLQ